MSLDILPSEPETGRARRSGPSPLRWVLSAVVVVLVAALIGGVTVAVRGLSGGGSQPEDALPAGAIAFAKVDLDPPAGQKINAIRFLRKFPALKDKVGLNADLRESLFEEMAQGAGWDDLSFDKDVAPWLGQRIGIAAYPGGENDAPRVFGAAGNVVVALQVTDEAKARAGLDRLMPPPTAAPTRVSSSATATRCSPSPRRRPTRPRRTPPRVCSPPTPTSPPTSPRWVTVSPGPGSTWTRWAR